MKIAHIDAIRAEPVTMEGARGVRMRIAIGEPQGAPNFVMRVFDIEPGGFTPHHRHEFEHEVFILGGQGSHVDGDVTAPLEPGDVVFVRPNAVHQFRAGAETGLRFMCLVPK